MSNLIPRIRRPNHSGIPHPRTAPETIPAPSPSRGSRALRGIVLAVALALTLASVGAVLAGATTPLPALALYLVGLVAGIIGAVIGFGTMITIPVVIGFGFPPVMASVSTTIGLVPGSISAAVSSQPELVGQGPRVRRLGTAIAAGSVLGAVLLIALPGRVFTALVPILIIAAIAFLLAGPWLSGQLNRRLETHNTRVGNRGLPAGTGAIVAVTAVGVYGGYYSGALGLTVLVVLGLLLADTMARLNALKCCLVAVCNSTSAIYFMLLAHPSWTVSLVLAAGSTFGGVIGPWATRRLSEWSLRIVITAIALGALIWDLH